MKPREINPECIDDDAWWDIEALKLAILDPDVFYQYRSWNVIGLDGSSGLQTLGFLKATVPTNGFDSFNFARIANFGSCLIEACQRVSKCTSE